MNEKEVAELRRQFHPDKIGIRFVRGCYVNAQKEIISQFTQSITLMPEDEAEKLLNILKKTLSGTLQKHLLDIPFTTAQVTQAKEHKLLLALRDSQLQDEEAIQHFFQQVIAAVTMEENYVILLAHNVYDVPYYAVDGSADTEQDTQVYSYILCTICPVKQSKPGLRYDVHENAFHNRKIDWLLSAPELGFLFPAFDDRSTNIYNALYYTKDTADNHTDFIERIFNTPVAMPANTQKEVFQELLCDALQEDCSLELVQAVHGKIQQMIETHKENKEPEPLELSKDTVTQILSSSGAKKEHISAFSEQYDKAFGKDTTLSPKNVVTAGMDKVQTASVTIQIRPGFESVVETRTIDGIKYILIRADEETEINGIPIRID